MGEFWEVIFGWDYVILGVLFMPFILVAAAAATLWDWIKSR